jgi:Zn-dependent metalloprotease
MAFFLSLAAKAQLNSSVEDKKNTSFFIQYNSEKERHQKTEAVELIQKKFNKNTDEQLKSVSEETDAKGNVHERYQHYYKGIKVEHGIVTAHSKGGMLTSISGNYPDISTVNMNASLTEAQALQKALDIVQAKKYRWEDSSAEARLKNQKADPTATYYPKAELVICKISTPGNSRVGSYTLAYRMEIYASDPISRTWFYVDANDGSIVMRDEIIKHANTIGTAATRYSGTRTINTEQIGSSYYLHDNTRGTGIFTYNVDVNNDAHEFIADDDDNWTVAEYHDGASDDGALDAHWGAMMTYDYWKIKHGRDSYDGLGGRLNGYVHFGQASSTENAFWSGSEMFYGGTANPFTSLDICGHEIGHGITQYTTGLVYSFESGALNEGFSDIWGACVEYYAAPAKQTWILGEDIYSTGNYIRSMSNPNARSQPDTYLGTYWYNGYGDNGGVHTNSGVINFWFYLLSIGGSGTNDNANAYAVTGITMDKAAEIAYQARFYLTPTAQYPDARNATIQAAIDLYGAGSNEVTQVQNAWFAVGLYANPMIAPTNLAGNATSATSVDLSWSDANVTITNFRIERSISPNINFVAIDTISSTATTYTDNTSRTDIVYYYRVRAMNGTLLSPYSNVVTVFLGSLPVIIMSNAPQTTCDAIFMDDGGLGDYSNSQTLTTTFTPSTPGASMVIKFSSFDLDRNYSFDKLLIYDGPTTAAPLFANYYSGSIDTVHHYLFSPPALLYASANNPTGQLTFQFKSDATSAFPGWVAHVFCVAIPAAPTNLLAIAASGTQSNLSWTDNANNESNYIVERSIDLGKTFKPISIVVPNTVAYSDAGLLTNAVYHYRTRAYLLIGRDTFYSNYSNVAIDTLGYIPFTAINPALQLFIGWESASDWGDYDNDGDLDLLISGFDPSYAKYTLIYNNNNGNFTDINAGLIPLVQGKTAWVDYDNDGDLDCFVSGGTIGGYHSKLYRNDKGIFTEINTVIQGTLSGPTCAAFGDYDNDGDMDLMITGYTGSSHIAKIYQNLNGVFTDINAGLDNNYATVSWGDYDNDGDLDILTSGYNTGKSYIDICQNSNGVFSVVNLVPSSTNTVSATSWGDYDNDGDLDVLISVFNPYTAKSTLEMYKNTSGSFTNIALGLSGTSPVFGDYDNDGDLDILCSADNPHNVVGLYRTIIYKNTNGVFSDVNANVLTFAGLSSFVDYDNDGDLDIFMPGSDGVNFTTQMYRNNLIAGSVPLAANANQAPTAPANLQSFLSSGSVTLNWNKATDSETPQNGLSYAIRIGTTPGGREILSPPSFSGNGYRNIVAAGNPYVNNSSNGNYTLNCLPNGTYYWSVQAVDNGYEGSAFAAEQTFTITNSNPVALSLSPVNNAVNIITSSNLMVSFSETMLKGTGFINLREVAGGTLVENFDVSGSPHVTLSGALLTIDPTNDLLPGIAYYVEIPGTAFLSSTCKLPFLGTDQNLWHFTTLGLSQTIIFNSIISKTYGDVPFHLNATSSSGLPITYISLDPTVATIVGNVVTIVGAGTVNITATQVGDNTYMPAASVSQILIVNKASQIITFTDDLSNRHLNEAPYVLTATASSGLPVVYVSSDPTIATVSGNVVTVVGLGLTTITVSQGGNSNYLPASDKSEDLIVGISVTAVTNEINEDYKLYPNPSEGIYFINGNFEGSTKAELINVQGVSREVMLEANSSGSYKIDITEVAAGLYLLKINSGTEVIRLKLIKSK